MEKYFINNILEMDCDDNGYLNVKFMLEGDEENTYRNLLTDEYHYWVEENFYDSDADVINEEWDDYTCVPNKGFDFIHWINYDHNEETVIEFIYDNFLTITELPKTNKI